MLVLMRKLGQKIMLGDEIEITVTEIGRGQVRLGIIAPRDIPIHRKEVWERIQDERSRGEHGTIPQ